jgi:hypothetical protein
MDKFDITNCIKVIGNKFLTIFTKDNTYYMVDFDGELVDEDTNYDSIQKMFRIFSTIAFGQEAVTN